MDTSLHHTRDTDSRQSTEAAAARTWVMALGAIALVAAVAFGVMLAGGDGGASSIDTPDTPSSSSSSSTVSDARPLPEFTAETRGGDSLSSSDIKGPAVVSVFASWCSGCQAHAPSVTKLQKEYPDLGAYYINVADDAAPAAAFIKEYGWADGPVLVDDDRAIASAFGLTGQPHTIFIDADGDVSDVLQGGGELGLMQRAADNASST